MLSLIFSVVTLGKDYFFLLFSATVVWSGVRKGKQKARAAEPRVAAGQARAWTLPGPVPQLLNGPSGAGDGQGQPQHCGCQAGPGCWGSPVAKLCVRNGKRHGQAQAQAQLLPSSGKGQGQSWGASPWHVEEALLQLCHTRVCPSSQSRVSQHNPTELALSMGSQSPIGNVCVCLWPSKKIEMLCSNFFYVSLKEDNNMLCFANLPSVWFT